MKGLSPLVPKKNRADKRYDSFGRVCDSPYGLGLARNRSRGDGCPFPALLGLRPRQRIAGEVLERWAATKAYL